MGKATVWLDFRLHSSNHITELTLRSQLRSFTGKMIVWTLGP